MARLGSASGKGKALLGGSGRLWLLAIAIIGICLATTEGASGQIRAETTSVADGQWISFPNLNPAPAERGGHVAVLDSVGRRMLIFGGLTPDFTHAFNDTWSLSLVEPLAWDSLVATGTAPPAGGDYCAIMDPVRDRLVVYVGQQNGVWALQLSGSSSWSQLSTPPDPVAPTAAQSAIYDPVRDRMLIFGGAGTIFYTNSVRALSLSGTPTWTLLSPAGTPPQGRSDACAIYDPEGDRMIVFGGYPVGDLWQLSLSDPPTWSPLSASGQPPGAYIAASAIYDRLRHRMIVFGGYTGGEGTPSNEVWELSLGSSPHWTLLNPAGDVPQARADHSAVYDAQLDEMILFGGTPSSDGAVLEFDHSTPVLASVVSANASPHRVLIRWLVPFNNPYEIQRRESEGTWELLGQRTCDGSGFLDFEDVGAEPGRDYEYELTWSQDGQPAYGGLISVHVPLDGTAVVPVSVPLHGLLAFAVKVNGTTGARLTLYDLAGRIMATRDINTPGVSTLAFPESIHWPSGIYLALLNDAGVIRSARATLLR